MLDLLKSAEVIVGLILASSTALLGIAAWWDGRAKRHAAVALKAANQSVEVANDRFAKVEDRLNRIEDDAHRTKNKLQELQILMAKLADKDDVARLSERTAAAEGHLLRMGGQLDTIYRAALEGRGE